MKENKIKIWSCFFIGIGILTFGARILLFSTLGVGGLDAVAIGLSESLGISIGTFIIILGAILIIIGNFINKTFKIAPVFTAIVTGCFYDLWGRMLFEKLTPPNEKGMIGFVFLIGLLVAPLGAAIYISSDISMGPIDYLMWAIKKHSHLPIRTSRIVIEAAFVAIAVLVGGPIGIGTICIMLFWGPILQVYYGMWSKLIKKKKK